MADPSDQAPSTDVSGDGSDIPLGAKIGYAIVAVIGLLGLAGCLGRRLMIIRRENLHDTPFIRWLVIFIYIVGILFISSSTILQYGFGLGTGPYCKSAILLCLTFYLSAKVLMYMFLVERARLMCLPLVKRKHDTLWLVNMAMVVVGFGIVGILAFIYLIANISPVDSQCHIGVRVGVTVALGGYDMLINFWLTGLFIKLAARYIRRLFPECISRLWKVPSQRLRPQSISLPANPGEDDGPSLAIDPRSDLARLARKTLVGSAIMMSSTIVNLAVLVRSDGEEAGWVCLLICTIDITVDVFMVHWVTTNPKNKA